jgi:glycerol-3-phosphate dehydrogenase
MRRNLQDMGSRTFDLAVIGGGITGSCIARDAARRGLRVALVEKRDFSWGTSSASSKLVHGGLRYLQSFEFGLVRESLRERRVWEQIAPHMVYPLEFLLPVYGGKAKFMLNAGLTVYDLLSFDRNRLDDPDKHMAAHRSIKAADALALEPRLKADGLSGAILYFDCQMYSPERLGLECLIDAAGHGASIANYAEVIGFKRDGMNIAGIDVRDTISGATVSIKAKTFINAAGPWADRLLAMLENGPPSHKLIRSKGIHVIVGPMTKGHALTVAHKGGHFFVLPWRGHTIIGTTDTVFDGDPDNVHVGDAEIAAFLNFVNEGLPGAKLKPSDVIYAYAGLRPLVDDGSKDSYNASRKAELVDHAAEGGIGNLISAIGGKWTTSRDIAEKCVDIIAKKTGRTLKACDTGSAPIPGGATGRFAAFVDAALKANPHVEPEIIANLTRNYGARYDGVLALAATRNDLMERITPRLPDIGAQILFAIRDEMALTLDDALFRRTGLGTLGRLDQGAIERAAKIMAAELGWNETETQRQIASVASRYAPLAKAA